MFIAILPFLGLNHDLHSSRLSLKSLRLTLKSESGLNCASVLFFSFIIFSFNCTTCKCIPCNYMGIRVDIH